MFERRSPDLKAFPDRVAWPARDVKRLRRGSEVIGLLVREVVVAAPGQNLVEGIDGGTKPTGDGFEPLSQMRFERRNGIESQEPLIGAMRPLSQRFGGCQMPQRVHLLPYHQNQQAVLGDGEREIPA